MKEKAGRLIELFNILIETRYSDQKSAYSDTPLCTLNSNDLKVLLSLTTKDHPGIKEIADELSLPMSTLTGIFNKLVSKGLVTRDRCEVDRRVVRVHLTPKGLEAAMLKEENSRRFAVGILESLTEDEQDQLLKLLAKMTAPRS